MKRAVAALALLALALPAGAAAHATLLRTVPANGAVLASAPRAVRVVFDDTVRVEEGNAAVANDTGRSVLAGPAVAHGDVLTLPLARGLADGDYSVRWSIVSDDGHREKGVIAFAVGAGALPPHSVLGAAVPLTWSDIVLRTLYYFGLLAAGGAALFGLLTHRLLGERLRRPLAQLLFFALLAVFIGASGIAHGAPPGTRYALVVRIVLGVSLAGGAAAALAPTLRRALPVAWAGALALLAAPTLSGHALDRNQTQLISVPADLLHVGAAAVWLGGLLALVYVVPRATSDDAVQAATARRFSTAALAAVALLAASGLARALTELSAPSQVWSTSYGRALLVKTALLVPLVALGLVNRSLLLSAFARLRRSARVEIVLLLAVVVAVAVLTELRPGRETPSVATAAAPLQAAQPPVLPPAGAVVAAKELGSIAVTVARTPGRADVTLVGADGTGVSGSTVLVDGTRATGCRAGCYRAAAGPGALRVTVDGTSLIFTVPERAPDARALLARVTRAYRASKTIVFDETLASSPSNTLQARFTVVAPDRLAYSIRGGSSAIVVGALRWDRDRAGAPWLRSAQTPLDVTQPYWRQPTNVHLVAPGVLTFLDRRIPAWFRLILAGRLPARVEMTAAGHFMVDRYVGFDVPAEVSPPPSR